MRLVETLRIAEENTIYIRTNRPSREWSIFNSSLFLSFNVTNLPHVAGAFSKIFILDHNSAKARRFILGVAKKGISSNMPVVTASFLLNDVQLNQSLVSSIDFQEGLSKRNFNFLHLYETT